MSLGEAIAIGFAAGSALSLLITYYLMRRTVRGKVADAARILGIGPQEASALEKEGQLSGALGLARPVTISPTALAVFLGCKKQEGG